MKMHFFASCGDDDDAIASRRHTPSRSPHRRRAMASSSSSSSSSLHAPDFAYTHDARAVRAAVRAAVHRASADTMSLRTLERASSGGYSTRMDVVTIALGGLDASRVRDDGLRVVLNYGEHGRELLPVDIAIALLEAFADGEDAVVALARGGVNEEALRRTLRATTFVVVPMENERGRALVEDGDLCERKNGRGVDPNRNWAVNWGVKEKDYDAKEEYPGTAPFSEPESTMLKSLIEEFKPHAVVNWHSGMSALFTPYDHVARMPTGSGAEAMLDFIKKIDREHCSNACVLGSGGQGVGYLAHGTAADYIYDVMKVPVVYTWEVYGDLKAPYEDCYRAFNPTTKEAHEKLVRDWVGAPITLVSMLPGHPDININLSHGGKDAPVVMNDASIASRRAYLADASPLDGGYARMALTFATVTACAVFSLRRRRMRRAQSTLPGSSTKRASVV